MGRKSQFSEAEIITAVRELEGGGKAGDVARKVGVSLQTLARSRTKYSGMTSRREDHDAGLHTRPANA